jgi:predicted nuclease of restriction endonuclease-like RecB superfamily
MLTSDLLRARMRGDEVRPIYLDPGDRDARALAEALVALFAAYVGRTRGELDDALVELIGEGTDYLLHRGLAKLLSDRATFAVDAPCDPIELRRRVFERAAGCHPVALAPGDRVHTVTRDDVLAAVAGDLGLASTDVVERALYADLERAHVLRALDPIAPDALLHRYNVALAQAVLLRASALTVTIAPGDPARYRQLFRFIKFYRLMHSVRGDRGAGYAITLDGPASLFQLSSKYGLQMAEFLPALLLCEGWTLRAELLWGKERRPAFFALESGSGLRSHYPDKGVYVTDEERHFVERFAEVKTRWTLEKKPEIIDLGGHGVLIPDFVLRHADDGREALLEIVGFWRKGYLESRLQVLREHGPPNLVLAVSKRLRSSEDELADVPGEMFFFRDVILTREVLERAERVGVVPAAPPVGVVPAAPAAARKKPRARVDRT